MSMRIAPPGLKSSSHRELENPNGPHHSATCRASVQTRKTRSRGASTSAARIRSARAAKRLLLVIALSPSVFSYFSSTNPSIPRGASSIWQGECTCSPNKEGAMAEKPIEKELIDLEKQYWQAIKNKDIDKAERLTNDPCLVAGSKGIAR